MLWLTINDNLVDQFDFTILIAATACLLVYFSVCISEIILLAKYDGLKSKSSKIHAFIGLLASIYSAWAFCGSGSSMVFYVMILFMSGMLFYGFSLKKLIGSRRL